MEQLKSRYYDAQFFNTNNDSILKQIKNCIERMEDILISNILADYLKREPTGNDLSKIKKVVLTNILFYSYTLFYSDIELGKIKHIYSTIDNNPQEIQQRCIIRFFPKFYHEGFMPKSQK